MNAFASAPPNQEEPVAERRGRDPTDPLDREEDETEGHERRPQAVRHPAGAQVGPRRVAERGDGDQSQEVGDARREHGGGARGAGLVVAVPTAAPLEEREDEGAARRV
jgi:hypothetical protein